MQERTGWIVKSPDFATRQDEAANCVRIAGLLSRRFRRWIARRVYSRPQPRLEALAEPGGICFSGTVQDHIGPKLPVRIIDLSPQQVKRSADQGISDQQRDFANRYPGYGLFATAPRQALDCGASVCQYDRRSGAGIFRRRDGRGGHRHPTPPAKVPQKVIVSKGFAGGRVRGAELDSASFSAS
jgi:hypothetical protein